MLTGGHRCHWPPGAGFGQRVRTAEGPVGFHPTETCSWGSSPRPGGQILSPNLSSGKVGAGWWVLPGSATPPQPRPRGPRLAWAACPREPARASIPSAAASSHGARRQSAPGGLQPHRERSECRQRWPCEFGTGSDSQPVSRDHGVDVRCRRCRRPRAMGLPHRDPFLDIRPFRKAHGRWFR